MAKKKSSYQRGIRIPADIIKSAAKAGITPEEMMVKRFNVESARVMARDVACKLAIRVGIVTTMIR